jgi:hypothetical protein
MKKLHFNGEGRTIWGDRSEIRSVVARIARHPAARVLGIIALATIIFAAALAPLSSLIVEGWLRQIASDFPFGS